MLKKERLAKGLAVVLIVVSPILAVSECAKNSDPGPFLTTCPCTGQPYNTTSCQVGYSGMDCAIELPGYYCGSDGRGECYVGYAYNTECTQVVTTPKKEALLKDDLEKDFAARREVTACGVNLEALRGWIARAPGFLPRESPQIAGAVNSL